MLTETRPDLHSYAFDGVTHHLFHPHGANSLVNKEDEDIMREVAFDDSLQSKPTLHLAKAAAKRVADDIDRLVAYYSPTLHKVLGHILYLFAKPRETPLADRFVLESSAKSHAASFTLLDRLQGKASPLEHLDIAAECLDHMAAGIDTTGDGLCFLMWELSKPSSARFQRRLQEELTLNPEASFDKLPYLDAVVMEALRCFPPIPMSLPRYVPRAGRTVDDYWVPGGTIVSCQAYSVHRLDQSVFPNPNRFNPDRWLQREGDAERKRLFFAFANGGRGCVGKQ
jgi:hypothetical protein